MKVEQPPGAGGELEVKEEPLDVVQVLEQAEGQSEGERKPEGASSTATTDFTRLVGWCPSGCVLTNLVFAYIVMAGGTWDVQKLTKVVIGLE